MHSYNKTLKNKLKQQNINFKANDNISEHITENDLNIIRENVHTAMLGVLDALVIDYENDHNTQETAATVAPWVTGEVIEQTRNEYKMKRGRISVTNFYQNSS